jgi:hypothetical protein
MSGNEIVVAVDGRTSMTVGVQSLSRLACEVDSTGTKTVKKADTSASVCMIMRPVHAPPRTRCTRGCESMHASSLGLPWSRW